MHEKIAIVGRPNVGKSTLFNRLLGKRRALVHDRPGTTRDRNEAEVSWQGMDFIITDTAGWSTDESVFSKSVKVQLERAVSDASIVLLVTDSHDGVNPLDLEINDVLRRFSKNVVIVVNKVDTAKDEERINEFYSLGRTHIIGVSANHGRNITELFEYIVKSLKPAKEGGEITQKGISVILVGKPNVGKSSLINALCKQERSIVHDKPGTTREAVDITVQKGDDKFIFIDTPGLHRRRRFTNDLEYLSALSATHAIERADVAVLVVDHTQGIGESEARAGQMIMDQRKACIVAFNKWDIAEDREELGKRLLAEFSEKVKFLSWSPRVLLSAKSGQRVDRIFTLVKEAYTQYSKIVSHQELKEVIRQAEGYKPLSRKGEVLRIRSVEQKDVCPPFFSFVVNNPELVHFSYRRYLENRIRDKFAFEGTPINLSFTKVEKKS